MAVRVHNSLTRTEETFNPIEAGKVRLYTCGPTVYNYPHIGNLRTFLFEDLLKRWLEYRGYQVNHVMNLTDVDDKTIKGSIREKISLNEYTSVYKKAFFEDLKALAVKPATHYPAATDYIPQMITIVDDLVKKGFAYEASDGVYFKVSAFKEYGKLAHLDQDELKAGASGRMSSDEYEKEQVADFALWKKWSSDDGDVKWPSPWGEGRPGWHIECSAMSMDLLGDQLDIHCGGIDNLFPHHENEIAQSEAHTGKPFSKYWMHSIHLVVDGEKMSKSKGNFYTLRDLLNKGYNPRSIRYALLTTHYRKPLNFTFDLIKQADSSLKRLDEFLFSLKNVKKEGATPATLTSLLQKSREKFETSLDTDLNISEAMAAVFELIGAFYDQLDSATTAFAEEATAWFARIDTVLGFGLTSASDELSADEKALVDARIAAKQAKEYAKADEIRQKLLMMGIEVRDTKDGAVWKRI